MVKRLTKEIAEKYLSIVPSDKYFYIHEGPVLKNMEDLSKAIFEITEDQFSYHRNSLKNDFYMWVLGVIDDVKLAHDIARARTKETTRKKIESRIISLKKIIS